MSRLLIQQNHRQNHHRSAAYQNQLCLRQPGTEPHCNSLQCLQCPTWKGYRCPNRWHAGPLQGYPQHWFAATHLNTWVERGTESNESYPRTIIYLCPQLGLKARPLNPKSSTLTMRPQQLHKLTCILCMQASLCSFLLCKKSQYSGDETLQGSSPDWLLLV